MRGGTGHASVLSGACNLLGEMGMCTKGNNNDKWHRKQRPLRTDVGAGVHKDLRETLELNLSLKGR